MIGWKMDCFFAPFDKTAKHCKKENEGSRRAKTRANKGYFGCAIRCRFYKVKE